MLPTQRELLHPRRVIRYDRDQNLTDSQKQQVHDNIGINPNTQADSTISAQRGTTDVLSADNLRTAYTAAKALAPGGNALSATNRAVVMIPAGRYDFGLGDVADDNHGLELDAEFVDLVGMTGKPEDVVLTSAIAVASRGTVEQTADDVKISGLTMEITSASSTGSGATEASAYFPTTALANAVLTDVICQSENPYNVYSMRRIEYAGTYTRVAGGTNSFGTTASGTFTDCTGGEDAFASGGTASGTFLRCVAGGNSFGVYGTASGTFTDCVAGGWSFGTSGTASGTFTNCVAGSNSFGFMGTASGTFTDCVGGDSSFGHDGTASGTFTDCSVGDSDSGFGHSGTASGIFIRCSGYRVARYATVTSTARFTDCHSIDGGYGQWGAAVDAGAVFIRCHGAHTGMNLGTTRLCYDTSNNLIDNSGEFITSATDNDAKLALTGLADGQQVEITDEGKRLERYTGDGARSATQDFTTVEITAAGNDSAGDPYAALYHWDASADKFVGLNGQKVYHDGTNWRHQDAITIASIHAAAGAASVHPADADWSGTALDGEIFARPIATERNWHTLKNMVYLTVDENNWEDVVVNGVDVPQNTTVGIGWVPVGELILANVGVSRKWVVQEINGDNSYQYEGISQSTHCLTIGTNLVLRDNFPSGALVTVLNY